MLLGSFLKGKKKMDVSSSTRLENIDENGPPNRLPVSCNHPETPTETMEFLARSWSLSAMEISQALSNNAHDHASNNASSITLKEPRHHHLACGYSPPVKPIDTNVMKKKVQELFVLHHALNPEFLSSRQLLRNGLYKSMLRGKTVGRWIKDQKERKKQELRTHNAQLHAAISVAGVAAAVATLAASIVSPGITSSSSSSAGQKAPSKTSMALASAAALVASHCIEMAEEMGAEHDQIIKVVSSAINARSNGDIMTLTAGAATALRGAAALRVRLEKGYEGTACFLAEDKVKEDKESDIMIALNFVCKGGELLKRTRKGALHWKQVSFNINSNWQVVAKMKSKHMAGTFTKVKKCVVLGVLGDIQAWQGRESEDGSIDRAYFGIKTSDRVIEFECIGKQMWTEGIQHMLNCCAYIA